MITFGLSTFDTVLRLILMTLRRGGVYAIVLFGLPEPTTAFVATIHGLASSSRDVRTASSSTRMSDAHANTLKPELERLFAQPSFHKTAQPDVTEVAKELKRELNAMPGRDPRGPLPPNATAENINDLAPKPATASTNPAVSSIQTVAELDAAVAARSIVVVKYYASWCRSCLSTKLPFEQLATGTLSRAKGRLHVEFLEVEFDASRVLTYLAGIEKLPCVQVYRDGELAGTHKIAKGKFTDFEEILQHHLDDI